MPATDMINVAGTWLDFLIPYKNLPHLQLATLVFGA
jgi:hypothetical protein